MTEIVTFEKSNRIRRTIILSEEADMWIRKNKVNMSATVEALIQSKMELSEKNIRQRTRKISCGSRKLLSIKEPIRRRGRR